MTRRSFIALAGLGMASVAIPAFDWFTKNSSAYAKPELLSRICDEETIQRLGREYLELEPTERNRDSLLKQLYGESPDIAALSRRDILRMQGRLQNSIRKDFASGRTIVLQGWILSQTEARQCALYFILTP